MPYQVFHKTIIVHLVYFVTLWINTFPTENGKSDILSPREIVMQRKMDYQKHCQVEFGAYLQAHDDPDITNTSVE